MSWLLRKVWNKNVSAEGSDEVQLRATVVFLYQTVLELGYEMDRVATGGQLILEQRKPDVIYPKPD